MGISWGTCHQCLCPHSEPNSTHHPPGDSLSTAVRSAPGSYGVTVLLYILVHKKPCVCSPRGVSFLPVLWSSCAEALLTFKARCSGGSSSWCQTPGFGASCGAQNSHSCGRTSARNYFWVWVEGHLPIVSWYNRSTSPTISLWCLHFGCRLSFGRFEPCLLMVIQKLVVILVFFERRWALILVLHHLVSHSWYPHLKCLL